MLIALGAAGVTLAVALGVIGIPIVDACSADPRGVITCLRDMADRKFDLPGSIPVKSAESVPDPITPHAEPAVVVDSFPSKPAELVPSVVSEHATPNVVVDLPPPPSASSELSAGEAETLPAMMPEQPVAVASAPEAAAAPARAVALPPAVEPTISSETSSPPAAVELAAAPETPAVPLVAPTSDTPADTALTWSVPPPADLDQPPVAPIADPTTQEAPATPMEPLPTAVALKPAPDMALAADPSPVAAAPEPEPTPAAGDAPPFDLAPAGTVPPAPPKLELANAEPAQAEAPAADVVAPLVLAPTIDAIELEGDASYVSGSGPAGALMRLYADGELIGESPVEEGRWLVEGGNLLGSPRSELRVEAIEPETGKLLGEAAITVEIELPDSGASPGDGPAEPPDFGSSVPPADIAGPSPEALAELPEVAAQPQPPVVASDQEAIAAAPAAPAIAEPESQPAAEPQIEATPIEPDPIVLPDPEPEPAEPLPELAAIVPRSESAFVEILSPSALEPSVLPPIGAIEHEPATITLDPPDAPALVADLVVPERKPPGQPVTVLRLIPFGDPDSGRYNVGKAIIRHGDTLWSLARRYYGHGIHYRTILNANRDEIRRPSRIFPGQIFDLPLVTDD